MALPDIPAFELRGYDEYDRTYWSALSITVGELMDAGMLNVDWWLTADMFSEEQSKRLWKKFVGRYQFREIGILPPKRWMLRTIAKLDEIMPKYKMLYKVIGDGASVMSAGDEYHKSRDVFSTFPQTALGGADQDYASTGTDREYETLREYGLLDVAERLLDYNDVDVLILDELDVLFMAVRNTDLAWM